MKKKAESSRSIEVEGFIEQHMMSFTDFAHLIEANPEGVVLLEGKRDIPGPDALLAKELAMTLASRYPGLRFRSGNAEGSDQAFSEGIADVDVARLQIIAPYAAHRKRFRFPGAIYDSPDTLACMQKNDIAVKTAKASPKNKSLVTKHNTQGALGKKAAYIIRDTMKVTGYSENFPKPICALFYVYENEPLAGGTGHTIRVCLQEGVPFALQMSWQQWIK